MGDPFVNLIIYCVVGSTLSIFATLCWVLHMCGLF